MSALFIFWATLWLVSVSLAFSLGYQIGRGELKFLQKHRKPVVLIDLTQYINKEKKDEDISEG